MPRTKQRAKLTSEERARSRKRTAQMWEDINAERERYNATILDLAEKHKKTRQWIAMQLFRGGKLLAGRRSKSLFNAVVHDLSKKRNEAGTALSGRNALAELAKEAAEIDWKNLPPEEQKRLLDQLQEDSAPPAGRIPASESGNHVEGILRRMQPELDGLAARTGCQYLLVVTKQEVTDNWATRVCNTPKMADACSELFKSTPETMAMKMEACITSGKAGVIRAMGGKRSTQLKAEIRAKVTAGLEEILTKHGVAAVKLPRMEWVRYTALVAEHGVELVGWPADLPTKICNPSDLKTMSELDSLHGALFSVPPTCYWVRLSSEEWEDYKRKHQAQISEERKKRVSDGKKASAKQRKKHISPDTVEDDDDDTNEGPSGHSGDFNSAQQAAGGRAAVEGTVNGGGSGVSAHQSNA